MTAWTTSAIRRRAVDLLNARGWAAGRVEDQGPISADWAIALASGEVGHGAPEPDGPYLTTMTELEALLGRGSLLEWELDPGRTAEDLINLLRSGEVAGGAHPPYTAAELEERTRAHERSLAAAKRQGDALRQMMTRSGPLYELARQRSRVVSEAYRAAGRPPAIRPIHGRDGRTYVRKVGRGRHWHYEPATQDEWEAWQAWLRQRARLRKQLGIGQFGRGNPELPEE